ncbi:nitroreductase family protein [Campylobacter fetus]|uniref:nitroreductase family protein n=1 Tax=Campylobacter fetus TaxID=196 RepID=UPI000FCAF7E7|nr:nitroreductase family protein [Campylobacter fetus]RUT50550.1 nitroreductase [Campylobacter fetus]RUT50867.1 nitroreductase [Campylobacter fetus]
MEFYEVINNRRTVREFEDKAIPKDVLERILDAGLKAPSGDHLRQWSPVVITERKVMQAITKDIKPFPCNIKEPKTPVQEMYKIAFPKQHSMLADAGCIILPYFKQTSSMYNPKDAYGLINYAANWALIENILLAATAEGLGCAVHIPVGDEAISIQKILHTPNEYMLPVIISVGYPVPNAEVPVQVSATVEEKVHWNQW